MTDERDPLPPEQARSFGHTLMACARLFDQIGQERLNADLGAAVARPSVMRLVPHLTPEGIRPTELARRVDVSKQAVGQTLAFLEAHGVVELVPDPTDRRARLVRTTPLGARMSRRGLASLEKVRREVEERVGAEMVQDTFRGLRAILAALEEVARKG